MKLKVRNHPIEVFYLTGDDAREARNRTDEPTVDGVAPCFTTGAFGQDNFVWETADEFEESYQDAFGKL